MVEFTSLAAVACAFAFAAPTAHAQTPSTLSSTGVAQADVEPDNRNSETSIRAAVRRPARRRFRWHSPTASGARRSWPPPPA